MKDSRYMIIGIILHVGWFLWVFYQLQYTGKLSSMAMLNSWYGEVGGMKSAANQLYILQIFVVLYSFSLLYFHGRYFSRSKTVVKKKLLHLLFIMGVSIFFIIIFLLWWNYAPPMSEAKALEYAEKKVAGSILNLDFNSIKYNEMSKEWIVEYRILNLSDQCTTVIIGKGYDMRGGGTCSQN
ncbi:hypothetical protein [Paenibacillus sp. KS-LC4]|uniref:hypothetical protein n=1 Tax=Paenibacillus sp. KS-LC4 TaxID=2979727 RepID=UPI0030CF0694